MAEEAAASPAPEAKPSAPSAGGKSKAPFILSLIGGIIILLNGILVAALGGLMAAAGSAVPGLGAVMAGAGIAMAVVGLVFGIIVLVGAILMRKPGKAKIGAILVLIFSILSIVIGGGFVIGMILGIIGGALGLKKS